MSLIGGRFPLRRAYPYLEAKGLGEHVARIKAMNTKMPSRSYNSTVRRGYVIRIMDQNLWLDDFIENRWPVGATARGKQELSSCLRVASDYDELRAGI